MVNNNPILRGVLASLLLCLPVSVLLAGCEQKRSALEEVLHRGYLVVLTRSAPTTYYETDGEVMGMEYDLVQEFARRLGVEARFVVAPNVTVLLDRLARGDADFAAAGLTATADRRQWLRFTPGYQEVAPKLVYRINGAGRPRSLAELDGHLEVLAQSSHAERLRELQAEYPDLEWVENDAADSAELLALVWEGVVDYTVADSHELRRSQHFYPELRAAFSIGPPEPLAWAFPKRPDDSLYNRAVSYFEQMEQNGRLQYLVDRHYGHLGAFDYVGTRAFRRHINRRLPPFQPVFVYAAEEFGLDWKLLAAISYQESHWDPKAVSPTGVRGLMMLTQPTARSLGVRKRTDPVQSIRGGAIYFKQLRERIPERIEEPDRTWLALAAYNVGMGHLEDARILTEIRGGNPDLWADVKESLPLLRQKKWYERTRHGYARGDEAVLYVENIRTYYETLNWVVEQERPPEKKPPDALRVESPVL